MQLQSIQSTAFSLTQTVLTAKSCIFTKIILRMHCIAGDGFGYLTSANHLLTRCDGY